jgi:hypothetical protein
MKKVQLVNNVDSTNTDYLRSTLTKIRAKYNDKRIIIDNLHFYSMGRNYADIETITNAVINFNTQGSYIFFACISPNTVQFEIDEIKAKVSEIVNDDSMVMLVIIGGNKDLK